MSDSCLLTYMKKKTYAFSFHKVCTFLLFSSPFPPLLSWSLNFLIKMQIVLPLPWSIIPLAFLIALLLQRNRIRAAKEDKRVFF